MNQCILLGLDILLLWWPTGSAETYNDKIVSPSQVECGKTFTVTCDASRAGVPVDVKTLTMLYIKQIFGAETNIVAHYRLFVSPYVKENTSPLHFENWRFNFSGSMPVANAAERPNNRNSMKIEIVAPQSKGVDAGKYVCFAVYLVNDNEVDTERYQHLTLTFRKGMRFNITPRSDYDLGPYEAFYPAGSKVELTCSLETQLRDVTIQWKFGSSLRSLRIFQIYSTNNDVPVRFDAGTDCDHYLHSSTLTVKAEEKYDGYMYVCVATENNKDTIVGNLTIYTVLGQETSKNKSEKIVNIKEVHDGGSFNVTCDASPASIGSLSIAWTNGTNYPLTLATHGAYVDPFKTQSPLAVLPPRNWNFNYIIQESAFSQNNRKKIKLEITVNNANCTNAGLYYCNATYAGSFSTFNYQNLTILGRLVPVSMTLTPQNAKGRGPYDSVNPAGSNVTLTCNVTGPRNLTFQWKFGSRLSNFGSFSSYPVQNAVSVSEPVFDSSGLPCVQYFHSSTLRFQTEDKYDGYMYVCVASENNRDIVVGNMTIYSKP